MTAAAMPPRPFGVVVECDGDDAILTVQGEIDVATAPHLVNLVDTAIEQGHQRVVLHLADIDFLGAAGLGIIASVAARLPSIGGELIIQAPSSLTYRLLGLTGLLEVVRVERPPGVVSVSPPAPAAVDGGRGVRSDRFQPVPPVVASDHHVLDAALGVAVSLAQAAIPGTDGVTVTLRRDGRLVTVATTDDVVSYLDAVQYDSGQGPCVAATTEQRPAHIESVGVESRWPAFTSRAHTEGMGSVLSTPLVTPSAVPGALNLYSRTPRAFGPPEQELAGMLAAEVSTIVTAADSHPSAEQRRSAFQEAIADRELIAQAQGVLIEREGRTRREAYAVLRQQSHESGVLLRDCAHDIVVGAEGRPPRPASLESTL